MQQQEASFAGVSGSNAKWLRQRPEYKRTHDLKKIALVAGLAALSWMSTYAGMLELVQANLGDLDLVFKVAIGASVAMLMLMVVWLLDQLFNESTGFTVRVLYIAGYLFLTLISVGFSFGFYWKFLESRSEASRTAESAVTQVQAALHGAETRLVQMQSVFDNLSAISTQKAAEESAKGNSCPNSRPGDGPRRRLREADAASFSTASQFVQQRSGSIKTDVAALDSDLQKIVRQDKSTFDPKTGTRNEFIKALGRKLEITVAGFNAFRSDPQLKQLRADFAERADKTTFPDDAGKTFSCPDPQISASLKSAVKAIDALPVVEKPEIVTVEGADATIEAFRRLNVTLMSLAQFKLPATPDQIRSQQVRAVASNGVEVKAVSNAEAGLGQRDYIPLAIALFVDLCLLLVSIPKPLSSKERTRRRRASSDGEVYRTLDDLYAIHDDPDARAKMEPLRHIAFDYMGHDYVAVPLIAGREGAGGDHDGSARNLSEDDLLEAQFIINFFASQERGGPFRRASFPPASAVRARLKKLGSKWAGIQSFRLYRFSKGAWSDFVLDMVIGADEELTPVRQKQREARFKKNEMKSSQIVFESELKEIEHEAVKSSKRKEAELNTLMIESNITSKQQEAELRRREQSAQSELNTLGLEASITAKRAEIERTKRDISRTYADDDHDTLKVDGGQELRLNGGAARKTSFWDKIIGLKDEAITTEPSLERKAPRGNTAQAPGVAQTHTAVSPDITELRQTVSELALIVRDLTSQHAAQAARAAASPLRPDSLADTLTRSQPVHHGHATNSADVLAHIRPGQNAHPAWPTQQNFDPASTAAATARLEPEFGPRPSAYHAGEASTVILMPNLSASKAWADTGHDRSLLPDQGCLSQGNAALAQAEPFVSQPRAHMPDTFRWAAESTMAGGVHRIDHAIEPMVADAIQIGSHHVVSPELQQRRQAFEAPEHERPPAGISTRNEIDSFIATSRDGAEDMAAEVSIGHQAGWQQANAPWQDTQSEPLGQDDAVDAYADARVREDIEIERIATKFGRGSSRRQRKT